MWCASKNIVNEGNLEGQCRLAKALAGRSFSGRGIGIPISVHFFFLSLNSLVLSNIRSGKVVFSARICYSYNMISYFREGVHYN